MKKIAAIIISIILGASYVAAVSAVDTGTAPAPLTTTSAEDDLMLNSEELDEELEESEGEEEEEEEGESIWNQTTITCFLVATISIILILNLMQFRRK